MVSKLARAVNRRAIRQDQDQGLKKGVERMASSRKAFLSALVGAFVMTTAVPALAQAQDYPTRLIKIVVPFPPGGNPDLAARLVANRMATAFGQSVIIENKPGAN